MSDMRPTGIPVMIGGEAHSLLFTLNVIDAVQSKYGETVRKTLKKLGDEIERATVLRFVITELLNDENMRNGNTEIYSEREIGCKISMNEMGMLSKALIESYSISMPEADDEESQEDDEEEAEPLDIAQLILAATSKMGYTEDEVFKMTARKFFLLFDKYLEQNGGKKKKCGIDDLP